MASSHSMFSSTVMQKVVVAISGLAIVGFLIGHLSGNLLLYSGPAAFNKYAQGLRDLGPLLWVVRVAMIVAFVSHIVFTVRLKNGTLRLGPLLTKTRKLWHPRFTHDRCCIPG